MHRYDENTPIEETLSTLNDLVRAGKVRYIGVSNWPASQIAEAATITPMKGWEPLVSLQPQYSILARDIEVEIVPVCQKFGLGIIPWSPLGGGMLTGKYKKDEEPVEGTRFAAPGPFQQVWRRAGAERAEPRDHGDGAGGGGQARYLADRAGAGVEPVPTGRGGADHRAEERASSSRTTWRRWT